MTDQATIRVTCRSCGAAGMRSVLSLGRQLVTGFMGKVRRSPLELVLCQKCGLVQLSHSVPPSWFQEWYGYRSGINPAMVDALRDVARSCIRLADPSGQDVVVDIGANDGTLLGLFEKYSMGSPQLVGFEPAQNLWSFFEEAVPAATLVKGTFPGPEMSKSCAKVVTAIAMFYDVEEPERFLGAVRRILADDGVFVVQMNGLLQMVESCAFDNISHEHNCYYSLTTFSELAERCGLEVFDVEENQVNGGSFRAYLRKSKGTTVLESWIGNPKVKEVLDRESGLRDPETYLKFARRKGRVVVTLRNFINMKKHAGMKVGVYGASTRGLVILESMSLPRETICCAAERNPEKVGMPYSGTDIQCVSEETARETCDVMLVLPYHFIDGILEREQGFLKKGGELVVPLPHPAVYYWDEGKVSRYRLL